MYIGHKICRSTDVAFVRNKDLLYFDLMGFNAYSGSLYYLNIYNYSIVTSLPYMCNKYVQ